MNLSLHIRAGYAGLLITTHEESRALDTCRSVATELDRPLLAWSCATGLSDLNATPQFSNPGLKTPIQLFEALGNLPAPCLLVLYDLPIFFSAPNPSLTRTFRLALNTAKAKGITLLVLSPGTPALPPDIAKLLTPLPLPLPTREELAAVIDRLCHHPSESGEMHRLREIPTGDELQALTDAASGLTENEAEDAYALSLVQHGRFDPPTVEAQKAATLAANGLLHYLKPKGTLADIGGWDAYKAHLRTTRGQFSQAAKDYGLVPTKGDLFVGSPGCGKSLAASILGAEFKIATLRCRLDSLRGSLLGQTEANWRSVVETARTLAPCILHLEEPDGLLSGHASSGKTDGGTTATLVKAMLQDIEASDGIYWILTTNDIDCLPDPLIDRLNVWNVDLPNETERGEIWQIQMRHTKRDPHTVCPKGLVGIVKATDGFSGRQIERVWHKALSLAFADAAREPQEKDILSALIGEVPTSKTMAATIEARRTRLEGKAKPVTSPTLGKLMTAKGRNVQAAG
jgi:AAA+ superfamily predicted ATPase